VAVVYPSCTEVYKIAPTFPFTKHAIMAGNYEGEGVTGGAGLCHGVRASFISAQDHALNCLLRALYAPRKPASSTLRACFLHGPRAPSRLLLQGSFPSFRSVPTKESYRDRSSTYARTPKRFNPRPYLLNTL
jgi:hypothetical protein